MSVGTRFDLPAVYHGHDGPTEHDHPGLGSAHFSFETGHIHLTLANGQRVGEVDLRLVGLAALAWLHEHDTGNHAELMDAEIDQRALAVALDALYEPTVWSLLFAFIEDIDGRCKRFLVGENRQCSSA